MDTASVSQVGFGQIAEDPVMMAAIKRSNRASLIRWAAANIENPGAPVPPVLTPDMMSNAQELVRRGKTDLMFRAGRAAQDVAWQKWMTIVFSLTDDAAELKALLELSARSIMTYADGNLHAIAAYMTAEQEKQTQNTHVDRREWVTRVLEGVAVDSREASRRLGYPLNGTHQAAILWIEEAESELSRLDEAAETLLALYGHTPVMLRVIANTATLWLWLNEKSPPHLPRLQAYLKDHPGVKIALGTGGKGIEGFRRAHLDALAAQRVMSRLNSPAQAASFDSLRLVALMSRDPEATLRFVNHTLGELVHAPVSLKRSLLIFLQSGCIATETAERLHTHRNTLLKRLNRAEELLPAPLEANRLHVAAALEALSWMDPGQSS